MLSNYVCVNCGKKVILNPLNGKIESFSCYRCDMFNKMYTNRLKPSNENSKELYSWEDYENGD